MRSAAFILLALPAYAMAQPASPAPQTTPQRPAAPQTSTAAAHKPAAAPTKPSAAKSPPTKASPAKPAQTKSGQTKPANHKPGVAPAHKAVSPGAPAAPAPEPEAAQPNPAEPPKGSKTGLPLPRFAALRSDDVNFRTGPGTRYPIEWVYKRRDLPVEIEREFDYWRLVRDPSGNKGWVNQATLTGRRTAVVAGSQRVLHQAASETAAAVAKLQPGVILRLRGCEANSEWCLAQIGDYRGYIKRSEIWGVLPGEVIQ
ncbi:MAG: SH3 domain-containing protein [Acetobacteraceae bacterium]|nr:SH3 domain-containing protein [Acetobacteraceae bacterium]